METSPSAAPPPMAAGAVNLSAPPVQQAAPPLPPVNPPVPAPVTIAGNVTPVMQQGGVVGFFKSLNWLEIGFMVLGSAALLSIMYNQLKVRENRLVNEKMQKQLDELKMNVQTTMKKNYKEI